MIESPHEKFVRLSTARLEKAQHAIKQLSHLGSKNYEFSEGEAWTIVNALSASTEKVREALRLPALETDPPPLAEGRLLSDGPLEPTKEESLYLVAVGDQLGAIVNALEDKEPDKAYDLLLNLMRS